MATVLVVSLVLLAYFAYYSHEFYHNHDYYPGLSKEVRTILDKTHGFTI